MSNKFERMMLIKKPNGYHPIFTSLSKDGHVLMSIITMSISNVIELFSRTFAAVMVILIECANEMYTIECLPWRVKPMDYINFTQAKHWQQNIKIRCFQWQNLFSNGKTPIETTKNSFCYTEQFSISIYSFPVFGVFFFSRQPLLTWIEYPCHLPTDNSVCAV